MTAKHLPGYNRKYLVREDGTIWRSTDDGWVEVAQSGDPPRVRLYTNGTVERPLVKTVLDRTFQS